MRFANRRAGFSLLEMLVMMAALSVVLALGGAVLLTVMRADRVGAATLRDLTRHTELADQFRGDVARATAAPDRLGELTAGPTCLILQTGHETIIYRWQDSHLDRVVRAGDKEMRRQIALNAENSTVEFTRPAGDRPILAVRVIETSPHGAKQQSEISAALGGDMR
jgi:Tfp pilus assembly protein FimT